MSEIDGPEPYFDDDIERASLPPEVLEARNKKKPKYKCGGAARKPPVCDYGSDERWLGPCPSCRRLYDIIAGAGRGEENRNKVSLSMAAAVKPRVFISTGIPEWDHVLAQDVQDPKRGGLVPGSTVLLGGPRGIGKTTLLLQTAAGVAAGGKRVLYTSGEQNRDDIIQTAFRLGIKSDLIDVMGDQGDVYRIVSEAEQTKPRLLIVDSIQTAYCDDVKADVGQVAQMDAVANYLTSFGKNTKTAVLIISHLNKDGDYAGSEKVQHLVDTLARFDPKPMLNEDGEILEETRNYRELSIDGKNRNGAADITGLLEMTVSGLKPVDKRKSSRLILDDFEDM
jgi:DNA repair protein RadA/Sms